MCAICGVIAEHGEEIDVGRILTQMLVGQQVRAQDAAGFAIYQKVPREKTLLQLIEVNHGYHTRDLDIDPKNLSHILESMPDQNIFVSSGRYVYIIKDLGLAHDVSQRYGVHHKRGTHGVGHIRIATSSDDSTPVNAHPIATPYFPDLAVPHNGEVIDYFELRQRLEVSGYGFHTNLDSEAIPVYLARELNKNSDFERANQVLIEDAEGPISYLASIPEAIAIVRDVNGLRKLNVGYIPETKDHPGMIAFATNKTALFLIGATKVHEPKPGKPEIYRIGEDFKNIKWL